MLRTRLGPVVVGLLALVVGLLVPAGPAPAAVVRRAASAPASAPAPAASLVEQVRALPHVVRVRDRGDLDGYRMLVIGFRQPVDHRRPRGATFVQRLVLLHRGTDRPTVLVTHGYGLSTEKRFVGPSEPTRLVDGNQLGVEHRFFSPSRPARATPAVWRRALTIRQAAADHHRVVTAFKRLYHRRWISTGASKSGMAATYFRRFYPDDVAATVAYVAPDDVVDDDDSYNAFLARVGTAACRDAVVAVQRRVLGVDRAWFLARAKRAARDRRWTWRIVGDPEKGFEASVVDAYFAFWQYHGSSECETVPTSDASRSEVWRWFEDVDSLTTNTDQQLRRYVPYYYQSMAQLGSPETYEAPLVDLLAFPGSDVPSTFVPAALQPVPHDASAMPDVDRWVRTRSTRMIFVYGGNDPWSAEPFSCGAGGGRRGCHRYVVADGTHGSQLFQLPGRQRRAAEARLRRWAGVGRRTSPRAAVPPTVAGRVSDTPPS